MMKQRGLLLIMLSLCMGIGAAWFANKWVEGVSTEMAADNGQVEVVVAAINIPYATKIEARHIKTIILPEEFVPEGVIMTLDEVDGYVSNTEVFAGEMLMTSRFNFHGQGSTLSSLIGENMRAISVRVDDVVGVAGFLLPGNYVDVLSTRMQRDSDKATTETILQKIKVLAVDQSSRTNGSAPVLVRVITLEMTLTDSEILTTSKAEGTIQLTLRNPTDKVVKLAKKMPAKRVIRPKAPMSSVMIIRGTNVATIKTQR
jgi:pilus assembly protein CpaB